MLMAVLAIEWSLLVHGFLHLHYDVCDVDNFSISDQQSIGKNISNLQHLEESYDQGSDHLESLHNISLHNKEIIDEQQLGMDEHLNDTQHQNINCNPSWPWININLHRWMMMIKLVRVMMMLRIMKIWKMIMVRMIRIIWKMKDIMMVLRVMVVRILKMMVMMKMMKLRR